MTPEEKLAYLKDLYDWDDQTLKNVTGYATSVAEAALRKDGEFAQMVRDNCGEHEVERYIQTMIRPARLVVAGEIPGDLLDQPSHVIVAEEAPLMQHITEPANLKIGQVHPEYGVLEEIKSDSQTSRVYYRCGCKPRLACGCHLGGDCPNRIQTHAEASIKIEMKWLRISEKGYTRTIEEGIYDPIHQTITGRYVKESGFSPM